MTTMATPVAQPRPPAPTPPHRRYLLILAVFVTALVAVVAIVAVTGRPGGQPTARVGTPSGHASPAAPATPVYPAGPDLVPAHGALFGAWVQPSNGLTQGNRLAAVDGLEAQLGRKLDIVNTYRRFEEPFPTESDRAFAASGRTLLLSWVINDTQEVASGQDDAALRDWAGRMRDFDHPMLVRLRWEMDRPNLRASMHSGADYVAAWKHVRALFAAQGVRDVSWVWCPTIDGFAGGYAQDFYPGDAQVDWLCVDAYAATKLTAPADLFRPFFSWAQGHAKPILIGEFGVSLGWGGTARADWLAEAQRLFKDNTQVKAVCYFDSDPGGNGIYKQYHLSGDPQALAAFAAMGHDTYFQTR
jgi:Glycosyl hydrolase family 26